MTVKRKTSKVEATTTAFLILAILLACFVPLIQFAHATEELFDSYPITHQNDNGRSYELFPDATGGYSSAQGQCFHGAAGKKITTVSFALMRIGSPNAQLTARVYAITGSFGTTAVPTGAVLASSSPVEMSSIDNANPAVVPFTFSTPYEMAAQDYFVVCEISSVTNTDVNNCVRMYDEYGSPIHAGNWAYYDNSAWLYDVSVDLIFYVYVLVEPKYPYVQQQSNVDSSADIGTHSNFTAQQYAPDLINDTMTEADNDATSTTSDVFTDGFEANNFNLWTDGGATTWVINSTTKHAGSYSATCNSAQDGSLTSDNTDCSTSTSIGVTFWYNDDDLDGGTDFEFYVYDGSAYDLIAQLNPASEDVWYRYTWVSTDSQYFDTTFRVRFSATPETAEHAHIDDVTINSTVPNTNYRLDLEEQFTNIPVETDTDKELCIFMGTYSATETIYLQGYNWGNATWSNITASLTTNQWSNISIVAWMNSYTNLTIRFLDGTQTGDTSQSNWQKDACLLHFWNVSGETTPPTYSSMSTNSTVWATLCEFSILIDDETTLESNGEYIFGCNNTGVFTNETTVNFASTPEWANVTKTLNSTNSNATQPEIVQFEWWFTDNAGNKNNTGLQTLTLSYHLSVGWNNVTIFSFDVGYTLAGINASLNYDTIDWSYIVYQNSSTTAQYPFVKDMSTNPEVVVYQTSGILLIFCNAAGNWTHTYPYQGGGYGSDPTPIIVVAVVLSVVGVAIFYGYRKYRKKKTPPR